MKKKKKLKAIVEKTDTGFSAYFADFPVFTTGLTISNLLNNLVEAYNLLNEDEAMEITPDQIDLAIDLEQFFKYYKVLNSRFLAERIGMNPSLLSQYVQGRKTPSNKQVERIITGIHQIGRELSEINLVIRN